jgi:phosphoserine phosphatase
MKKGIVCLDFDSTICKYETLDKLIKDLKLNNKKDVNIESITKSAMNGSVDFFDSLNYRMSFVTGITKEKLQEYTD